MTCFKLYLPVLFIGMITLAGCAGSLNGGSTLSDDDLLDRTFQIEDVSGRGVIENSHITLLFGQEGLFSGRGGCNAIFGTYERNNTEIKLGSLATTKKLCLPVLMHQEQAVLDILSDATRVELDNESALIIRTGDGRRLRGFESTQLRIHTYQCDDGVKVAVSYPTKETAELVYNEDTIVMTIARSASGARYIGDGWQWWTKGDMGGYLAPLASGETIASEQGVSCRKQLELQ